MLKSLEKLREYTFIGHGCTELADEIQAEVDEKYIPRDQALPLPLFEDGEPANFGDEYLGNDGIVRKITSIHIYADHLCRVYGGGIYHLLSLGERLKRPPEPDSQEKIDEECHRLAYVVSQAGNSRDRLEDGIRDLLARQRKLDGVE